MDVIEAMETCRAIRYLKPDPVPQALIEKVIYAATRASSPGNSQGWDFVVLRDRATKAKLGPVLRERLLPLVQSMPTTPGSVTRMIDGGTASRSTSSRTFPSGSSSAGARSIRPVPRPTRWSTPRSTPPPRT